MLKRLGIGLIAVAALAVVASASAQVNPTDHKNAAKYCKALRADIGGDAFKGEFGNNHTGRNALGRCIAAQGGKHKRARLAALAECKDELTADPATFVQKYGPGLDQGDDDAGDDAGENEPATEPEDDSGDAPAGDVEPGDGDVNAAAVHGIGDLPAVQGLRAALAHCVNQKVKTFAQQRQKALRDAFKECKAQRRADPEGFRAQYGSNRNKRNALGKCVSQEAKAGATSP
jgi:hypothetical protein